LLSSDRYAEFKVRALRHIAELSGDLKVPIDLKPAWDANIPPFIDDQTVPIGVTVGIHRRSNIKGVDGVTGDWAEDLGGATVIVPLIVVDG
jgi:hypothetical protein